MRHITLPVLDESETREVSRETLEVEDLPGNRLRLLHSPAFVWGIARADIIRLDAKALPGYAVLERGGNVAVVVSSTSNESKNSVRLALEPAVAALGGLCEGGPGRALVFSIPVAAGFSAIESLFADYSAGPHVEGWWYGNVYGPGDRPKNWWAH
jgi:hypothetical protein